ncbi:3-dehydroquinate synthase [soil metagenome]
MKALHRIPVAAGAGRYEVVVGPGVWDALPAIIAQSCPAHRYAVITDSGVAPTYAARLVHALRAAAQQAEVFAFPAGEAFKTREQWASVTDAMLLAGHGRDTAVAVVGGGVPGDLGGFVAATYMRGLPWVQVPTTLLAMVDASVGGKTAVDTPSGKNLVGVFHPPRAVIADPETLRTLPREHLRAGLAEAVKHGAIADGEHFAWIGRFADRLLSADAETMTELVARSVEIKAEVVSRDEREAGPRKALNFGHTIGHAVEAASGFRLLHGEAVAIGMVAEARLGERLGVSAPGTAERLRSLLASLELPTSLPPEITPTEVIGWTRTDKKSREGRAEYVLLARIGIVDAAGGRWGHAVPDALVHQVLAG